MTNSQQLFISIRPTTRRPGRSPNLGGTTMFPFFDRLALALEHERRREAADDHLARLALAARHEPALVDRGALRDLRLAAGAALVRVGQAILPREECQPGPSHRAA